MRYRLNFLLLCGFIIFSNAWAGIGPVSVSTPFENTLSSGILVLGQIQAFIEPGGNGQIVSFHTEVDLDRNTIGKLYSHAISANNQVAEPTLIATIPNALPSYFVNYIASADNGNAILYFIVKYEDEQSYKVEEGWSVYYDAVSGWRTPTKIDTFNGVNDLKIYFDSNGVAYTTRQEQSSSYTLYQYLPDNSWSALLTDVNAESFAIGGNNRLYRVHESDTDELDKMTYLSFINEDHTGWETPILISEANTGTTVVGVRPLVSSNGDIFALNAKLEDPPNLVFKLNMRKYDASTSEWIVVNDELTFDVPGVGLMPFAFKPFFLNNKTDNVDIMVPLMFNIDNQYSIWKTARYNEINKWQPAEELHNKIGEKGNRLGALLSALGNGFITDNNGHAVTVMCRENCDEKFAKFYNTTTGWSDELALPGLGINKNDNCNPNDAVELGTHPQVAVNPNGDVIIANGFTTAIPGTLTRKMHIASTTGDIITATSNINCKPLSSTPSESSGNTGDTGNTDNGGIAGDNSGPIINGGSNSSASMSYGFLLLLLILKNFRLLTSVRRFY